MIFALWSVFNISSAQSWHKLSIPPQNWTGITCSADGTKLAAAFFIPNYPTGNPVSPVYTSNDSGMTWSTNHDNFIMAESYGWTWAKITSSADGSKIFALADLNLMQSDDYGTNWLSSFVPAFGPLFNPLGAACSADGECLFAIYSSFQGNGDAYEYESHDHGLTWTSQYFPQSINDICCSANGTKVYKSVENDSVYVSHDSGGSWSSTSLSSPSWCWLACSASGNTVAAALCGGSIFISQDSGASWTASSAPAKQWDSIAISAEGKKIFATYPTQSVLRNGNWGPDYRGGIFASTDAGKTWVQAGTPNTNWVSIACSADGNKVYAVTGSGEVWMYQSTPSPELNLTAANDDLLLSWIIPVQNMVLQKSTNLISWLTITNVPVLNLSNLENQVTLPFSGIGGFFRLSTP